MSDLLEKWLNALASGDVKTVDETVQQENIDINIEIQGVPPITIAARHGFVDVVEWLLKNGADIDKPDSDTATPLMSAVLNGHKDVVTLLLDRGAGINARNDHGFTPADFARSSRHQDIFELLLDRGGKYTRRRTVMVTGAGFTKAFYTHAPLLLDTFDVKAKILPKYERFPFVKSLLESELRRQADDDKRNGIGPSDRINLERLMTRVTGGMPYDVSLADGHVLSSLLADLKDAFLRRIGEARMGPNSADDLAALAYYCMARGVSCITFNYDTLYDEALLQASAPNFVPNKKSEEKAWEVAWNLHSGYGFYCPSSSQIIGLRQQESYRNEARMFLLKIHGSMNWYPRLGSTTPFRLGDFVHHELWERGDDQTTSGLDAIKYFSRIQSGLEQSPFIVPPVLTKAGYMAEPLLRLLWAEALDLLQNADTVIFVGFSLPVTDIAATYLFREGCVDFPDPRTRPEIFVVDYAANGDHDKIDAIKQAYNTLFPGIPDDNFRFDGGGAWATDFITKDMAAPRPAP